MMAGANEILSEAGCALVGGHTSEGAELALGFAVNGLVDRAAVLRKGGLQARRRADPHEADRHRHPARRRYARQSQGRAGSTAALEHMTQSNRGPQPFCGGMAFMRRPT